MNRAFTIPRSAQASTAFLTAGMVALGVYALTESVWLETAVVLVLSLATFVAVAAVASSRAGLRSPWTVLAASSALWFVGWLFWQVSILLRTGAPPASPSVADGLFMSSYVLLAVAVLLFVRAREPRGGGVLEAAMIATVAGLGSWLTLIGPALENDVLVGAAGWTQAGYAALDVLMLAALARALLGTLRGASYLFMLGAVACLLAGDTAWNWLFLAGNYAAGGYYDLGWIAFSVLLGAAALHPSAGCVERVYDVPRHDNWRRLAVLVGAGAALPALIWGDIVLGLEIHSFPVAGGATVLAALVLGRAFLLLHESERLRRALAGQNTELKELDRLKDDFVASVSHELRTPLTSIRGYLELVREGEAGELNEQQEAFLGIVDRNAERLLSVVGDLLFVAQLDAGAVPLDRRPLDPAELARQAADSARPLAQERGIELSLEMGLLPEELSGDQTRLAQALDNLVSNALKFTPAGGTVALRAAASNGSVALSVVDSGPGISERDQRRLFQRFYRTEQASSQAVPGTGLGLAITKAIVEAHGGTIAVSSEVGHGTEFRILLPAAA